MCIHVCLSTYLVKIFWNTVLFCRPGGFLFDKEAILEYIITKKNEYCRKLKEYEKQKRKEEVIILLQMLHILNGLMFDLIYNFVSYVDDVWKHSAEENTWT